MDVQECRVERFTAPTVENEYGDVLFYCMNCDAFSEYEVNSEYMGRTRRPYCSVCLEKTAVPMPLLRQVGYAGSAPNWTAHNAAINFIVRREKG